MAGIWNVRGLLRDPRLFQITTLLVLLAYGMTQLGFDVGPLQVAVTLSTAIGAQVVATKIYKLAHLDLRSALISGLSLCLLLRANQLVWVAFATAVAIFSKFVIRSKHKHVFNPTNFGIIVALVISNAVWVSPGQWGSTAIAAFFFACLGFLVTQRAERSDVTLAFLGFHAALTFGRAFWLGDPLSIPVHQLQDGALLLFAFFMISDPKTTPDSRPGRVVFALLVAIVAYSIRFSLYQTNSLLWSLVVVSFAVRLIDFALPGARYEWPRWVPQTQGASAS